MTSRVSRRTVGKSSSRSNSPQVSTTSFRERSRSPMSPTCMSRIQEKQELQNLNDRLACYIDTVRRLESENSRLNVLLKTTHETSTREVTSIKNVYEKELSDVRKALDDTARDKAKLQLISDSLKKEAEDLASKLAKRDKDLASTEKQLKSYEIHNQDLQRRLTQVLSENKKLENQLKEVQSERDKLAQQLLTLKRDLEGETLLRVDIENRLQSMKEDLQFKESFHQQEVTEIRHLKETEVSELDTQLKENYDQRLSDTLRQLREEYESQMRENRDDIESLYETKIADLQAKFDRASNSYTSYRDEMRSLKTQLDSLMSKYTTVENQNISLQNRIRDLEKMLEQEREWHSDALQAKDEEIQILKDEMDKRLAEYRDLLDIKIALDLEISAYRKLLEGEEIRLNMSPGDSRPSSPQLSRTTPVRSTKRRRVVTTDTERSSHGIQINSRAKGDVEIAEQDLKGKFIKLHNKGNTEVAVGGWQLMQIANNQEVKYKFHRSVLIKPNSFITVWSFDSGVTHAPPQNYLMKNQAWLASSSMTSVLLDGDGEEAAARESSKLSESSEVYRSEEH